MGAPMAIDPISLQQLRNASEDALDLERYINDDVPALVQTRLGGPKPNWAKAISDISQEFQQFLLDSGYQLIGDYAAGLNITALNQVFNKDGELYRASAELALPYVTTGVWADESSKFVSVGDAMLRQDLADPVAPGNGAAMVAGAVRSFDSVAALRATSPGLTKVANLNGYRSRADGGGALYYLDENDSTSPDDGGSVIVGHDGVRWKLDPAGSVSVRTFGAVGDGITDDSAAFSAWAAYVFATGREWSIPAGRYVVDAVAPLKFRSSGSCAGTVLIPKTNQTTRFEFARDTAGTVLSTNGWFALTRGASDVNALNAAGKTLYLLSTEVQIERIGSGGAPYLKQEFIRCQHGGSFSTPLVNTYNSLANLTVTAHDPSRPIIVNGLRIELTDAIGGTEAARGYIVVQRDNVTLNDPMVVDLNPAEPKPVAIEVGYCANAILNRPVVRGFDYIGLGYGVLASTTIGLTINSADIQGCRHAYAAAFDVDTTINGGLFSRIIDSHWTDRFVANNPHVYARPGESAFEFAGSDVTLNDPVVTGGRNLLGIRVDTPSLGGRVAVRNPKIFTRGEPGYYWCFGYSSPNGPSGPYPTYTNKPRLPDHLLIENADIDSDTDVVYGAYLGMMPVPHTTWGTVELRGKWMTRGNVFMPILAQKNGSYQQDRQTKLIVNGPFDCGPTGSALYVVSLDSTALGYMRAVISGVARGNLRFSGYGLGGLECYDSTIFNIENDDATESMTQDVYLFRGCVMAGTYVRSTFRHMAFHNCLFANTYTEFPEGTVVTMIGNARTAPQGALPLDIRNNVATPFS